MNKVHLCCGDVYLKGYINVDVYGDLVTVVSENINETELENYYKKEIHDFQRPIMDRRMHIPHEWKFENNSLDEVLMICAIEHFSKEEAQHIINLVYGSLKKGGVFKFDFPDVIETVNQYKDDPEYMMRLIYGSGKNEFGFHKHGYTEMMMRDMLGERNWRNITQQDIVKHQYPMIGMIATK